MEQRIIHACGHEQVHILYGFDAQMARKARWLRTTRCRSCFIADKQAEQTNSAMRDGTAIAHLNLPALTGSERQIGWATTVRTSRLAALTANPHTTADADCGLCLRIVDAKWWIDHRDLPHADFLARAAEHLHAADIPTNHQRSEAA